MACSASSSLPTTLFHMHTKFLRRVVNCHLKFTRSHLKPFGHDRILVREIKYGTTSTGQTFKQVPEDGGHKGMALRCGSRHGGPEASGGGSAKKKKKLSRNFAHQILFFWAPPPPSPPPGPSGHRSGGRKSVSRGCLGPSVFGLALFDHLRVSNMPPILSYQMKHPAINYYA